MADYFPLLSRTIASLGDSNPEQRGFVYRRAREVLEAQLNKVDPPLEPTAISAELNAFDETVIRVEREARRFDPPPPPAAPPTQPVLETPDPASAPAPAPASASAPAPLPAPAAPPAEPLPEKPRPPARIEALVKPAPRPVPASPNDGPTDTPQVAAENAAPPPIALEGEAAVGEETLTVLRPRIVERRRMDMSWLRPIILGFAIASLVVGVGILAFVLRDEPADFEKPAATAAPEVERKLAERLPSETAPPAVTPGPGGRMQPDAPVQAAQRAALFEEPGEGSLEPRSWQGRVVWRLDTSGGDVAVRAAVQLDGSVTAADILIRRNRDINFPASHLVEFRFRTPEGVNGPVRDIGVPEMRQEEGARGVPLAGLPVPVTENVFLMGLTNLPAEIERNRELLRTRNWILLQLRFANGRRGVLLVEKGPTGERVVTDALQAWR